MLGACVLQKECSCVISSIYAFPDKIYTLREDYR